MTHPPGKVIHRGFWDNKLVEVIDNDSNRSLYFSGSILQSRISLTKPYKLILFYPRYMASSLLVQPSPKNILMIGIGAGSLIHFVAHHFPDCNIDAVDNSSKIIEIARGFFFLSGSDRISIHCQDGFEFLAKSTSTKPYDIIFIDAFDEKGMAKKIYSKEFLALCNSVLSPEGVISCNLWSGDEKKLKKVQKAIHKNSTSQMYLPVRERENIIALAFKTPIPWKKIYLPKEELTARSQRFGIDFVEIVKIAQKHNMKIAHRITSWLT